MAEMLEPFRSGMCVFTSRAIDAMKDGKPGDKIGREAMASIIGRDCKPASRGYANVNSAINYVRNRGIFWQWVRSAKAWVCLAPDQIADETQRGVSKVHRTAGRVLKGAACCDVKKLTTDQKRQFDLATTRAALARTATSAAMAKRMESAATLKVPTLEDLEKAFA